MRNGSSNVNLKEYVIELSEDLKIRNETTETFEVALREVAVRRVEPT